MRYEDVFTLENGWRTVVPTPNVSNDERYIEILESNFHEDPMAFWMCLMIRNSQNKVIHQFTSNTP